MTPDSREKLFMRTGIVCQGCRKPVVEIEKVLPDGSFFFQCPACGHWWSAAETEETSKKY